VVGLKRRRLGRTGLMVTELGLGAMDTPTSPEGAATLEAAIAGGIDFVDTAREYAGSEFLIGEAVRARGDAPFRIGSKTFSHGIDGSQRDVDRSLSMLGVERIDLYQLHDISTLEAWAEVTGEHGALEGLQIARYRELIGHIGISCHNNEVAELAIRSGEFDTIMLEYSAFFTETVGLIDLAAANDIGVIVMRPLGGSGRTSAMRGRLADGYDGPLTAPNLLRYVLSNPAVTVAIPGARYPSRVVENIETASTYEPMSEAERGELEAEAARYYY
jgi:aryl-alcohol dehydrogenase-like predicted oxidoreductase